MAKARREDIPRTKNEREKLRSKGQFWTPDWVAEFMAAYVLSAKPCALLDPAVGEGVFLRAAKHYARSCGFELALFGRDVDPDVLQRARQSGLDDSDLRNVEVRDFVLDPPSETFPAIIANPPYIRHHRLSSGYKAALRDFARQATGRHIDGRAGLHVYFLLRALQTLSPGGRLCYIVSADICEGVFAQVLWQWITSQYRLDAVVTFSRDAAPFPGVDTNALIFCIQNDRPVGEITWVKCLRRDSGALTGLLSGGQHVEHDALQVHRRSLAEALATGLSRPPASEATQRFTLGDFASAMRGIVTGNNGFFFMTLARARELGIPESLLVKAIGRTRDVEGEHLDPEDIQRLEAKGRPTRLLYVNGLPFEQMPVAVQDYLRQGQQRGLPAKSVIRTRNPWYRMETRQSPPILFAYLGRRDARFIRNRAQVVPLTCLLCVYPKQHDPEFVEHLWNVLSNPETISNLRSVGKSYGADAIKVEPRALERLPLPEALVHAEGLHRYLTSKPKQGSLEFGDG